MTNPRNCSHTRRYRGFVVLIAGGWLLLASAHVALAPWFGAFSLKTWLLIGLCWLWLMVTSVVAIIKVIRDRAGRRWTAGFGALAVLAGAALWPLDWPVGSPERLYQRNRAELAALADNYQAGAVDGSTILPWRLRALSVDDKPRVQCWHTDESTPECRLHLLAWQDWRGNFGYAFAYYPDAGPAHLHLSERELGDGWWWMTFRP